MLIDVVHYLYTQLRKKNICKFDIIYFYNYTIFFGSNALFRYYDVKLISLVL